MIVPVLSSATIFTLPALSIASDVLNKIPFFAPTPPATIIATGVASPSAHGQLITSTEIPRASANETLAPAKSHAAAAAAAIKITMGTKTPLTLSAIFATGAFVAAESLTNSMIFEREVSLPTRTARHFIKPLKFIVAAFTALPAFLSTGRLSPVRDDSSTAVEPSITIPSAAMLSPGRTTKTSPALNSSIGMTSSAPSRSTQAALGASCIRLLSAVVVLPFAFASSSFPTVMSVTIIAADSK